MPIDKEAKLVTEKTLQRLTSKLIGLLDDSSIESLQNCKILQTHLFTLNGILMQRKNNNRFQNNLFNLKRDLLNFGPQKSLLLAEIRFLKKENEIFEPLIQLKTLLNTYINETCEQNDNVNIYRQSLSHTFMGSSFQQNTPPGEQCSLI